MACGPQEGRDAREKHMTRTPQQGRVEMEKILDSKGAGLLLEVSTRIIRQLIAVDVKGSYESCGLPLYATSKLMRIPGLRGLFCSVLSTEHAIYEKGCRWCGVVTQSGRFCGESCRQKHYSNRFGEGRRLTAWLKRHVCHLPGDFGRRCETCRNCGGSLAGKRSDATFCSDRCKMAYRRLSGNPEKGPLGVTTGQQNEQLAIRQFSI